MDSSDSDQDLFDKASAMTNNLVDKVKSAVVKAPEKAEDVVGTGMPSILEDFTKFVQDPRFIAFCAGTTIGIAVGFALVKYSSWAKKVVESLPDHQ